MKRGDITDTVPEGGEPIPSYRFYPVREAVFISMMMAAAIAITTFFIFDYSYKALKGEIREGLARTASVLALLIDADLHETFTSRDQERSAAYSRALAPLANVQKADTSIAFAYTAVMRNGKVCFVLDPTPAGDANGDGVDEKSHIMQEYKDAPKQLVEALRYRKVVTTSTPYHDQWGDFMAAFAPFYDSANRFIGVVGIEVRVDNYEARHTPIWRATLFALLAGSAVAVVVGFMVWYMRSSSRTINTSRQRLYAELLNERMHNASSGQRGGMDRASTTGGSAR